MSSPTETSPGLVGLKKQGDTLISPDEASRRRVAKLRRVILGAAKGIEATLQADGFLYRVGFVTLTYARDEGWRANHIKELVRHYRRWCQRRGEPFRCVWVAELTKRGRVHYHIAFWLRRGLTPPKPDKQGWWMHGNTNVQWARKPVAYLVKYASKGTSNSGHRFPKGCRLFAVAGPAGHLGWFRAPQWCRALGSPGDRIVKRGEFWWNLSVGVGYRSPWLLDRISAEGLWLRYVGWTENDVRFLCNG